MAKKMTKAQSATNGSHTSETSRGGNPCCGACAVGNPCEGSCPSSHGHGHGCPCPKCRGRNPNPEVRTLKNKLLR